jgi:FtsZ-binding cell division protein ZapB
MNKPLSSRIIQILEKIMYLQKEIQDLQTIGLDLNRVAENAQFAIDNNDDDNDILIDLTQHWHDQIKEAIMVRQMIYEKIAQLNEHSLIIKHETCLFVLNSRRCNKLVIYSVK